jgi:hypothetical protein
MLQFFLSFFVLGQLLYLPAGGFVRLPNSPVDHETIYEDSLLLNLALPSLEFSPDSKKISNQNSTRVNNNKNSNSLLYQQQQQQRQIYSTPNPSNHNLLNPNNFTATTIPATNIATATRTVPFIPLLNPQQFQLNNPQQQTSSSSNNEILAQQQQQHFDQNQMNNNVQSRARIIPQNSHISPQYPLLTSAAVPTTAINSTTAGATIPNLTRPTFLPYNNNLLQINLQQLQYPVMNFTNQSANSMNMDTLRQFNELQRKTFRQSF